MRIAQNFFLSLLMTGLVSCVALGGLNRMVPGASTQGRYIPWHDDGVFISVHRTMGPMAAENSIEAIRECYLAGGDAIDCDLRFTQDRVLVTIHDRAPKGSGDKRIGKMPWDEVRKLDLEPRSFPGQKIPRFEDILRYALANNLAIHLDPKEPGTREAAMAILKRYNALHLINWPLVPTVYNKQNKDNDAAFLGKLFNEVEGRMRPYFMAGCEERTVALKAGDPRHFRCDDPRTIAELAGRTPDVVAYTRGPYRKPVPERGITTREQDAKGDAVNRAP